MKRLFLAFQIALISVLVAMSTATTALAFRPVHKPFSAAIQATSTVNPGRSWSDDKGIWHVRGMVVDGLITGDINGQIRITQNLNLDATFTGNIQADAVITVATGAVYRMLAYINVKALVLSGIFLIWGTGSLEGIYVVGTVSGNAGGVANLNGMQLVTKP
jgi:hypothetical protein